MPDNDKKNPRDDKMPQKKQDQNKPGQQPISQPGKDRDKGDKIEEQGGGRQVGNDNDLDLDEDKDEKDEDQVVTQRNPRVDDDSMKDVE